MFAKVIIGLALSVALPAWSQVDSSATGVLTTPDSELQENDLRMKTPPPGERSGVPDQSRISDTVQLPVRRNRFQYRVQQQCVCRWNGQPCQRHDVLHLSYYLL